MSFSYSTADANYPLNFAGNAYPTTTQYRESLPVCPAFGSGRQLEPSVRIAGTGVYGASYTAAAGIYKNLGYLPQGYDGVDNSPAGSAGAGLIDEMGEGVNSTNQALVQGHLNNHTHSTARSEMLYALLVEGRGPWDRSSVATISPKRKSKIPTVTAYPSLSMLGASHCNSSAGRCSTIPTFSAAK